MKPCFCNLNLKIFPFNRSLEEIMSKEWDTNQMSRYHPIDDLNPDLLNFFKSNDVKLINRWLLIHWWNDKEAPIHTDGGTGIGWTTEGNVTKRLCSINWNFTPGTWVEFYDFKNLTPYKRNEDLTNTFYLGDPIIIDKWNTTGPVILNTQIPHSVRAEPTARRRITCSLSFHETFESITFKLHEFIT